MKRPPLVYVLGAPRSGTTLLRVMLAGHPRLFAPPEMLLAPSATMAEREAMLEVRYWEKGGLRRALMELDGVDVDVAKAAVAGLRDRSIPQVYDLLRERLNDRILVDKCPHLSIMPDALARTAEWYPEARYIWIVRHPGSVIRSLQNMHMAEVILTGFEGGAQELYRVAHENIRRFLNTVPADQWTMIRYEDMVTQPRSTMEQVCQTIGLPFHEDMVKPYEGDRMREGPRGARAVGDPTMAGRGRIDPGLATRWLAGFDPRSVSPETAAVALELGYDLSALELPPLARLSDAMRALWDTAHELEQAMDVPADVDAAEGRRFLLRMLAASVDTTLETEDPDRPAFEHAEGPYRKMFADNPDTDYLRAPIRTANGQVYCISGRIPADCVYAGVVLYGRGGRVGPRLRDDDLCADEDGRFQLFISTQRPDMPAGAVWLQAQGDEQAVMVRQYYTDRLAQSPIQLQIERLPAAGRPDPLTPERMLVGVERARKMLKSVFQRTLGARQMVAALPLNTFAEIPSGQLFPTPDNVYKVAWYRFASDQIITVRGRLPRARYFNIALYNTWMESFDARHHRSSLNHAQLQAEPDGSFEIVVCQQDPGHPNWLDAAGHEAGYLLARFLLPQEVDGQPVLPELSVRVQTLREWKAERGG